MAQQSIEQELNELRSLIAKNASSPRKAKMLTDRLAALEERIAAGDSGVAAREHIYRELAKANNGKPGFLSHAQIGERCNMTKSATHHHVNALEKAGKVWIRKTHDPKSGRPCFLVYHPAAVRA